jgi:DNA-binding LacI/PurR family transcriptional regulator
MSHIAIRRGLKELVDAGLIVRRPRVGAFVQQSRPMELARRLGVVVPHYMGKGHPFLPVLMGGMMSALDQRECAVSMFSYKNSSQFWHEAGETMLARGIEGAVIFTGYMIPIHELEKIERSGIKAVLMNMTGAAPRSRVSTISIDFSIAMRETMQRLIDLGHRRIAWMSYTESAFEGIEDELIGEFSRKYDLEDPRQMIRRLNCEPCDYPDWEALLSGENRPTAVVLQDEFMAHEIFHACRQLGLSVPDDVSLVSLADSLPRSHAVPLSAPDTITCWTNASHRAAEHLRHLMETGEDRTLEVTLHAAIQWKASTDKPRQLVGSN